MRRLLIVLGLVAVAALAHADVYRVQVTRKDRDLYRVVGTRFWIETRWCFEFAVAEDAVLRYDPNEGEWGSNKLFFDSGGECDVVRVIS